jgi:hypothetical protein
MEQLVSGENTKLLADFLDEHELAADLGKAVRTLRRWRVKREGPPFVTLGRKVLYRRASIVNWLVSRESRPARGRSVRHGR